jgi:amino acid adenylation domain-containing protein
MVDSFTAATDTLSARQRRLLELLQQQERQAARTAGPPAIPRRPAGQEPVLSFGQKRLWFIEQLQPGSAAYHVPGAVRIRGPLDVAVLQRCLLEVARRHEILRTGFVVRDGEPVPVIAAEPSMPLPEVDLSGLPEALREPETVRVVNAQVLVPFDLTRSPLARTSLVRLAPEEAVFLLILQHIISDIWSVGVFFRNTMALYDAFSAGQPSPLPPLPVQYTDYAAWQQSVLQGASLRALLDYWKGQVDGASLVIELPTDHPRPPIQSFSGGRRYMTFPLDLTNRLKAVAKQQDASLYMILLAALDALLFRLTGQRSILVGVPMANRNRLELEGLIGLLFNALALRADLDGGTTVRTLLAQVRERTLGAIQHQDLPFERLVEELRVERDMSRNPIYQVLFAFQNVPPSAMAARDLSLSRYEVMESTSREDLELDLRETPDGLAGWFGYDEALFDVPTVERIALSFRRLLEGFAADPEARLGELRLLTDAQEQALLYEWNDTAVAAALAAGSVSELFAAQAARTPEAVAAEDDAESLTYAELRERVLRTARALAAAGVRRGDLVAILAPRSVDLLTVVLGVLEAGAAWLPLDPEHPARRHAQLLEQGRVELVVAGSGFAGVLEEAGARRVLAIAEIKDGKEASSSSPSSSPADLAYVIFTSGSTGLPKGAAVVQRGMVNHLFAKILDLGLGPGDVIAQTASQCFDISVWQMLAALVVGGRVRVLGDEVAHDPGRLLAATEAAGITILETVPSLLRLMLDAARRLGAERPPLAALRWLVPTGEALPPEICAEWLALYPHVPLLNAYGPTECSDDVTHHPIAEWPDAAALRVPIGRPVCNTHLLVVDADLRPVPIGVAGELCVGGAGVGLGYLHDPLRTAQVFVPDPWAGSSDRGARLYRTGDLARRLADGRIDFLGRIDHQVKVRGFRIELGEIETVLGQAEGVRQAVVLAQDDRLVAFVVLDAAGGSDLHATLTAWLRDRLPPYMIPGAFVRLDALPLTPNGKLDRKALAALQPGAGGVARGGGVAPRNPVEESLAGIWAEVLKVPAVGVYDDFFEAGGQSLLATQVVTRVREVFGVDLPVRTLFQKPTVAGLAESLEVALLHGRGLPPAPPMTRIPDAERQGPLPPSFGQERFWFIDQLRPGLTAYNIFGAVRMRGRLDAAVLQLCFDELIRRHEVLRSTFAAVDGRPMQVPGPAQGLPIGRVDLRGLPENAPENFRGDWAARLKDEEAQRPFDLARGPLIRGVLLQLGDDDHVLAVTAHHIVYDVWSRELLIRELGVLYEAFWHRRPSPLPELPIQYADFAHWQRRWLRGEVLTTQLDYWRKQLAGVGAGTELPGDRPRPPVQSFRGRRQLIELTPRLTANLKELSRRQGVTLFMALLAGFDAFLQRYTGEDDVVVGSPIANRNRAETEALIGFFVNTQVLRTSLEGEPSLRQVMGRVRETALAAYAHQDLAFEQLVNDLRPSRDPARQPLFQILFNFLTNYQPIALELPELSLRPEANHSGAVQFDLIFSLYEADGALHVSADYSTDLFDDPTMARMMRHWAGLLEAAAAEPERPLVELPLESETERQQLLAIATGAVDAEPKPLLPAMLAAQAAATPEAVAALCDGRSWTYAELHGRADRMAGRLRRLGVGPDAVVALLADRHLDFLATVLGIWKAGGAYLPLDRRHPAERLRQVVAQSGARLVLVERSFVRVLAAAGSEDLTSVRIGDREVRLRVIEELLAPGEDAAEAVALPALQPENLAYVLYTSGSTGVPKGVMVTHGGLANHVRAKIAALGLGADDVVAQTGAHTFDISVWQLSAALAVGGGVRIVRDAVTHDPARLLAEIDRHGVTIFQTVPSLLAMMLAEIRRTGERPRLDRLRWLFPTGEALPADLARRWFAAYPRIPLLNGYGPTECADNVTHQPVLPEEAEELTRVAIGRVLPNLRLHVLGADLRPVPFGVPGELCVGGVGVGRGYLHDPARTAEAFVPDPSGADPGGRLYRTRDLVRHRADGALDFLGRVDRQVKVRGVRIELGEIEAVLLRHPGVREAAVLVKKTPQGDPRLVAFLVAEPEVAREPARLRTFLGQALPESMLPTAFVVRDAMPLTASGKLDRRALDALDVSELIREAPFVAPRTPLEEQIAAMWSELLNVERVGALDNFFDLGGHSLLTTQLVSRMRAAFQLEVPLPTFFEDPTVSGLAQAVELARWAEEVARQAPLAAAGVGAEGGEMGEMEEGEL